jgi:hypothetical protein
LGQCGQQAFVNVCSCVFFELKMEQNEFYWPAVFEEGKDEYWGLVTDAQTQHRLATMHRYGFCARNRSSRIEPGRTIRGESDFIRHAQIQAFYVSHQSGCPRFGIARRRAPSPLFRPKGRGDVVHEWGRHRGQFPSSAELAR